MAALATLLMGLWARHPFGLATGLGVNAFVAITVATTPLPLSLPDSHQDFPTRPITWSPSI